MKRIVSMLIAVLFLVNNVLAYTTTVKAKGLGMVITSGVGNVVTVIPKLEEIKGWEVEEGNIEIVDNQFTMPEENVKINAILEEATYLFKLVFPYFTNEENRKAGEEITVQALTENEGYVFKSWTAEGITLTSEQQVSASISFTMPSNAVTLTANYEDVIAPTLATSNGNWYTQGGTTIEKSSITSIALVDSYTLGTVVESWDASKDNAGTITAYLEDDGTGAGTYKVTIAGNGVGKMFADSSCRETFSEFSNVTSIIGLNILDTSNVTSMYRMFDRCSALTNVDVSRFDTSKVTDMMYMFDGCSGLTSLDVSGFNTSNVTNMQGLFYNCDVLTSVDVSGFDTSNVTNMLQMFYGCETLTSVDVSGFNTSKVTRMDEMFSHCSGLTSVDVSKFDTSKVSRMDRMFCNCSALTGIALSGFNTSNVTDMSGMFDGCSGLTSLDVSGFDTSNVTDMNRMFSNCSALTSVDVSRFNTSKVTDMSCMFFKCGSLTSIDVSGFNTSNVANMTIMFSGCSALTSVDVSRFNTSNVTDMEFMFSSCSNLTSLDLSSFDTRAITSTNDGLYKFAHDCIALTEIILGENFGQSTNIQVAGETSGMFYVSSAVATTIIGANETMKAYDWATDNRTVAFATGPNAPKLGTGLTPVNWNGNDWVTTDEANWDYNYEIATAGHGTVEGDGTGKWANAQTADGSLYVWIPRYTYMIESGYHQDVDSWSSVDTPGKGKILVKFSNGTTDDVTEGATNASEGYIAHPAFKFGTDELEGIWVAKYEASRNDATESSAGSGTTVSSKPGVVAWTNLSVSNMYDYAYNMNRTLDSHLMKNSEWGAVAYLTNAIGKIPYINNSSMMITGNAGGTQDASSVSGVTNAWNTANGVKASTTHNIYGVYDLSGGADEYVAAHVDNDNSNSASYASKLVTNKATKYVETYPWGGTLDNQESNYAVWSNFTGAVVYETSSSGNGSTSWDGDYSNSPYALTAVFVRGGQYGDTSSAGIFSFNNLNGNKGNHGFRPVLAIP